MLQKYTTACHCFDQIAAEKNIGDTKIMDQLRNFPKGCMKQTKPGSITEKNIAKTFTLDKHVNNPHGTVGEGAEYG